MSAFAEGVSRYGSAQRDIPPKPPVAATLGTTRLLDFGEGLNGDEIPLLVIPSLINRYTVLDLGNGQSFLHMLTREGFHPFVVDWDAPGPEEKSFDLTAYIVNRLEPLLAEVQKKSGKETVGVVGYCMGGLLALALASRNQQATGSLALLATPWDFHTGHEAQVRMLAATLPQLEMLIDTLGELPIDVLQAMFTSLNPWLTFEKFQRFARTDLDSPMAQSFVALEDWLNNGVPLAGPVAKECLRGWYVENRPYQGRWTIGENTVDPTSLSVPTLTVIPEQDHIVPPESARALADMIPGSDITSVPTGHIGMVAGRKAHRLLHEPLVSWFKKNHR